MNSTVIPVEVPTALWEDHAAHRVVLVRCVEPRMRQPMDEQFMGSLGHSVFDGPFAFAGGAMVLARACPERDALVSQLKLLVPMGVQLAILTVHPECGGYGISDRDEERAAQERDLKAGAQFLQETVRGLAVEAYSGEVDNHKNGTVTFAYQQVI